jgi:leucyl-tRNA synthetase
MWISAHIQRAGMSIAGPNKRAAIAPFKKDAPKYAQKLAKAAHSLSAEALGLDEFETPGREKAYLAAAFGVPVEIRSADDAGEDPKGKSRQAEPGRPAIYNK